MIIEIRLQENEKLCTFAKVLESLKTLTAYSEITIEIHTDLDHESHSIVLNVPSVGIR